MGGLVYRTFSEPLPRVRNATLAAFKRMAIKPGKTELGERILAQAGDRDIQVELEALTPNTTRLRASVRRSGGFVVGNATGAGAGMDTDPVARSLDVPIPNTI